MSAIVVAILLLIGAGFSFSTATVEWREVRDDARARMVRRILGDVGARTFYIVLGIALLALAVGVIIGRFAAS